MTEERWVGQTLAGKYRVERVLGKGGMGLVVEARHIKLDEPVAIKLLRPAMMEVEGMVTRFVREARAASKIKSEHVVRVTDVDILPDGVPYMVMELLSGVDFFDLRAQRGTSEVPAPLAATASPPPSLAPPPPAPATAPPATAAPAPSTKPTPSPTDLPDTAPVASAMPGQPAGPKPAPAKKPNPAPRPEPPADPFGGRRR